MPNRYVDDILSEQKMTAPIQRTKVTAWMQSDDNETLGAFYHAIADRRFTSRIEPPLAFEDYQGFARSYLGRCLREDPSGVWVNSRYAAGWDVVSWIASLWQERDIYATAIAEWKVWLESIYREGDDALRTCLVTATLEHLFEQPGMAKYFADWKADSILSDAYAQAMEWVTHGGESPLGKRT